MDSKKLKKQNIIKNRRKKLCVMFVIETVLSKIINLILWNTKNIEGHYIHWFMENQ